MSRYDDINICSCYNNSGECWVAPTDNNVTTTTEAPVTPTAETPTTAAPTGETPAANQ